MRDRNTRLMLIIVVIAGGLTLLHLLLFQQRAPSIVLEELYYIPLLLGTLFFGRWGVIGTYCVVSAAYLPFFSAGWTNDFFDLIDRVLHLVSTAAFLIVAVIVKERLRQQQLELDRDRSLAKIGQVAATIVHDLKNPLICISGFARRIQERKGDPAEDAAAITDSVQTMQRIVHDVLDFSKPVPLTLQQMDVREVVDKAVQSCRMKAGEKNVALAVEAPHTPVVSAIDAANIQRALTNLINNAIEASSSGQTVIVSLDLKKPVLLLRIIDTGSGMDSQTAENVFVPFCSRKAGGTGLGMPIAKKLIEAHGGRIRVRSKPAEGTVIDIELPFRAGPEPNIAGQ